MLILYLLLRSNTKSAQHNAFVAPVFVQQELTVSTASMDSPLLPSLCVPRQPYSACLMLLVPCPSPVPPAYL